MAIRPNRELQSFPAPRARFNNLAPVETNLSTHIDGLNASLEGKNVQEGRIS